MSSVTVTLFVRFFKLCEIGETTCNYNLVKMFYKLQLYIITTTQEPKISIAIS